MKYDIMSKYLFMLEIKDDCFFLPATLYGSFKLTTVVLYQIMKVTKPTFS